MAVEVVECLFRYQEQAGAWLIFVPFLAFPRTWVILPTLHSPVPQHGYKMSPELDSATYYLTEPLFWPKYISRVSLWYRPKMDRICTKTQSKRPSHTAPVPTCGACNQTMLLSPSQKKKGETIILRIYRSAFYKGLIGITKNSDYWLYDKYRTGKFQGHLTIVFPFCSTSSSVTLQHGVAALTIFRFVLTQDQPS